MHHCHDIHHMCFLFIFILFIVYLFFLLFIENVQMHLGIHIQCMHKNRACVCFLFYSVICDITTSCHFLTSHVITTTTITMTAITPTNGSSSRGSRCDASQAPGMFFFYPTTTLTSSSTTTTTTTAAVEAWDVMCLEPQVCSFFILPPLWPEAAAAAPLPPLPPPPSLSVFFWNLFHVYFTGNACTSNCTCLSYVLFSFWLWKHMYE